MTFNYPKVTYSCPKVTYSDPKVTYSDPCYHEPPNSFTVHCNHCCCPGGGAGGGGGGAQETLTSLITHTRTLLTTATNTDTVLIPVNYRGTEIFQVRCRVSGPRVTCRVSQTVTEHNLVTSTTTDYSVQTLLSFVPATQPFYPLAPTLHR